MGQNKLVSLVQTYNRIHKQQEYYLQWRFKIEINQQRRWILQMNKLPGVALATKFLYQLLGKRIRLLHSPVYKKEKERRKKSESLTSINPIPT